MHTADLSLATASSDPGASQSGPVLDEIELAHAARNDAPILFSGQPHARSLAMRIHNLSGWCWGPFLVVDCGEIAAVLEERLFRVLQAEWAQSTEVPAVRLLQPGTLFLHEVGRLGGQSQGRLRDLLGDVGTGSRRRSRRRIMASTSEDLVARVAEGTFDDRLFYRLNRLHFVL